MSLEEMSKQEKRLLAAELLSRMDASCKGSAKRHMEGQEDMSWADCIGESDQTYFIRYQIPGNPTTLTELVWKFEWPLGPMLSTGEFMDCEPHDNKVVFADHPRYRSPGQVHTETVNHILTKSFGIKL